MAYDEYPYDDEEDNIREYTQNHHKICNYDDDDYSYSDDEYNDEEFFDEN